MRSQESIISDARKRELGWLGLSVLLGSLLAIRLTFILDWAWVIDGAIRTTFYSVVSIIGVNVDVIILFSLGVVLSWVGLFLLDETKRAQKPLLLVSLTAFLVGMTILTDHWTRIKPGRFWYAAPVGFLFGGSLILIPHWVSQNRYQEYPGAVWAMFVTMSAAAVTALIDLHILNSPANLPDEAQEGILLPPTSRTGLIVNIVSVIGIIIFLGGFLLYRDHHSTVLVSPDSDGVLGITVLTGLYDQTGKGLDGSVANRQSAELLGNARGNLYNGNEPQPIPPDVNVEFSYFPRRTWSRRRILSAKPIGANQLDKREFVQLRQKLKESSTIRNRLRTIFLPQWVQQRLSGGPESLTGSLAESDVAVLVVSMTDFWDGAGQPQQAAALKQPDYIDQYAELVSVYKGFTPTIVALLDAELLETLYQEEMDVESVSLHGPDVDGYVRERILSFEPDLIVPLSGRQETGTSLKDIDKIRQHIDTISE